jgi:tight adherence protein C
MENLNILAVNLWVNPIWDWVISICAFGAVALGVVAIFSQPGQVKLSPQREAAIATGHLDRRTVFENPVFRPFLWILLSVAHHLRMPRVKAFLRRQLVSAGSPNFYTPEEYLALSILAGLGLAAMLEIVHLLVVGRFSFLVVVFGLAIGTGLSVYQIADRAAKRLQNITRNLPYAMDLISLAMGAGATFTEAVETIVREGEDEPLNVELRALLAEIDLGTTRRQSLQDLAARVPIDSMQSLVASVLQAEELGTPLGTVLHDQATLLRLRRSVRAENKAAVASIRILVPCLLLTMAVILTVFGPSIVRGLQGGLF